MDVPSSWQGVAYIAILLLFQWLNKRDSLRHDDDAKALRSQNGTQAEQIAVLTSKQATTDTALAACVADRLSLQKQIDLLKPPTPTEAKSAQS